MYSALEGVDEVVESFSQSFSSFRLPVDGQEEKPSAESGLRRRTHGLTKRCAQTETKPNEKCVTEV